MEFLGDNAAKRVSQRESARLNKEASEARKEAGVANERAKSTESNNVMLSLKVEVLRKANDALEQQQIYQRTPRHQTLFASKFSNLITNVPVGELIIFFEPNNAEERSFGDAMEYFAQKAGWTTYDPTTLTDARFKSVAPGAPSESVFALLENSEVNPPDEGWIGGIMLVVGRRDSAIFNGFMSAINKSGFSSSAVTLDAPFPTNRVIAIIGKK